VPATLHPPLPSWEACSSGEKEEVRVDLKSCGTPFAHRKREKVGDKSPQQNSIPFHTVGRGMGLEQKTTGQDENRIYLRVLQ